MSPTFLSTLLRDYLADPDSITAGIPNDATLRKQSLSDTALGKPPRVLIAVEIDNEKKHPKKAIFAVAILLTVEHKAEARAQAETWMTKIKDRIVEAIAVGEGEPSVPFSVLAAWIDANRTEQQRTGWQIRQMRLFSSEEQYDVDDDTKTFTLSLPMRVTVHLA